MRLRKDELLASLPPEWPEDLLPRIRAMLRRSGVKVVVLDDDPTGTQTVHNVPVLTEWSVQTLAEALAEPDVLVYVLTNSRSLHSPDAQALSREIAANLKQASKMTGRDFVVVSRSDSTLRGHYPGEVVALADSLDRDFDGTLIIPFFLEGGRLTIDDVHYVAESEWLVPAGETEFARDAVFGYRSSNLRDWVSEKHNGQISPQDVAAISLSQIRLGGPDAVAAALGKVRNRQVCIVNSASYRDMEVFVAGLLQAEDRGQRFIYRTAASFVRVRGGLAPSNLLTGADLSNPKAVAGGLVIAGSYIKKSTDQIEAARSLPGIVDIEVSVRQLLDEDSREEEINRAIELANDTLKAGKDALIYTSRQLVTGADEASSLQIGRAVSSALVRIVAGIAERPRWVIAKGGITSSDVATKGLGIRRAMVLGQAIPGVPIWLTGEESRWPGMVYVVFPGNVGGPDAIAEMIRILRG